VVKMPKEKNTTKGSWNKSLKEGWNKRRARMNKKKKDGGK